MFTLKNITSVSIKRAAEINAAQEAELKMRASRKSSQGIRRKIKIKR